MYWNYSMLSIVMIYSLLVIVCCREQFIVNLVNPLQLPLFNTISVLSLLFPNKLLK